MAAVDPTYPLYPIACLLASAMLLLVLLNGFIRHSWNLGVAFLCFWLFFENLTLGINTIVWSNNFDVKYYAYCDIVTHIQVITATVKPMATLIIVRRLYLIASLRSVELPDKATLRKDLAIEWTLGLVIPLLVAGPLYYVVQGARFSVTEGFGCHSSADSSLLGILLVQSWAVICPLLSILVYYPRVVRILYYQKREMDQFLQSNNSMNYYRIFALASIDVVLTLPIGITTIALISTTTLAAFGHLPIYGGWTVLHTLWQPEGIPYSLVVAGGTAQLAQNYFTLWSSPVLAFAIFGLFGFTVEARASYRRVISTVGGKFGWKPTSRAPAQLGTIEFGERPRGLSVDLEIGFDPSFIDENARIEEQGSGDEGKDSERKSGSDVEKAEQSG